MMKKFNYGQVFHNWQMFRLGHGLFLAGFDHEYRAVWLRDNLYAVLAYYYCGDRDNASWNMRQILNTLKSERRQIHDFHSSEDVEDSVIDAQEFLPVKWDENLCHFYRWCHRQVDAIGLLLFVLGFLESKGIKVINSNDPTDSELVQDVVYYLAKIRYGSVGDFGAWEEGCKIRRTSSIGSALSGLQQMSYTGLVYIPQHLFGDGELALGHHLPYESKDGHCGRHTGFTHCCDANQLSLIWPLNIVDRSMADQIMSRLIGGHHHDGQFLHKIMGQHGFKRYVRDEFWRSSNGVEGEWPMFHFVMSIIHSHRAEYGWAEHWFVLGLEKMRDGWGFEIIQEDGTPNRVLNWTMSLSLIAFQCLNEQLKIKYRG